MSSTRSFASTEVFIAEAISALKAADRNDKPTFQLLLFDKMRAIIEAYVKEKIEDCTDLKFDDSLARSLIAVEDFSDLLAVRLVWFLPA